MAGGRWDGGRRREAWWNGPEATGAGRTATVTATAAAGRVPGFPGGAGRPGLLAGQREQRIALGAGEAARGLVAHEEHDKEAREQQAKKQGNRYDGHAWYVWRVLSVFSPQQASPIVRDTTHGLSGTRLVPQALPRREPEIKILSDGRPCSCQRK